MSPDKIVNGSKPNLESVDKKLAIIIERVNNMTDRLEQSCRDHEEHRKDVDKRLLQIDKDSTGYGTTLEDHTEEIKSLRDLSKNWNIINSVAAAIAALMALFLTR
jgi:hypothetical protein